MLERFKLRGKLLVRLITNGSLLHRSEVRRGIKLLAELGGEVWFKIDRAEASDVAEINGVPMLAERVARHLEICAGLAPTWVQTCWFALDGLAPTESARAAYCALLKPLAGQLGGVHLYGLARPSMQPAASRLERLSAAELASFAGEIHEKTGIRVMVSP